MAINITQFAPPSRVSSLVWDDDMQAPAGKTFEGDLVGNVAGDVTGDLTGDVTGVVRGSLLGYLSRNGVLSASSGTLVVPASTSAGNTPTTVNLNLGGGGTYAIVGNTQKCFLEDPCNISIALSAIPAGYTAKDPSYAKSFTSDNVEIDSISDAGNLNIYGAAYIVLNGGTCWNTQDTSPRTMSVADTYIDAGTSLILGDDTPPDGPKVSKLVWDADMTPAAGKKFDGDLTGNVTGNVTGKIMYEWTISPQTGSFTNLLVAPYSTTQIYQVSPGETMTGTIRCRTSTSGPVNVTLLCISCNWRLLLTNTLSNAQTTYTLPEGTNGIYIANNTAAQTWVEITRFNIT